MVWSIPLSTSCILWQPIKEFKFYRPFSKMVAKNSNKFKLAKIKNVYQHYS